MSDDDGLLTITVTPAEGVASLDLLLNTLDGMRRVLRRVDETMYGPRSKHKWSVNKLTSSAPTITIEADPSATEVPDVIVDGIRAVNLGISEPPPYFSEPVLEGLTKLSPLFHPRNGLQSLTLSVEAPNREESSITVVDRGIVDKAKRILAADYHNLGSIEGTLEIINAHAPSVTVWERVSGAPVRCALPPGSYWIDFAKNLLTHNVLVAGDIKYFTNGIPRSISAVEVIEDAPKATGPMKATFGSLPDPEIARLGSAAWLKKIRGYDQT